MLRDHWKRTHKHFNQKNAPFITLTNLTVNTVGLAFRLVLILMVHPNTELKPLIYQGCAHILTEGLQPVSDMLSTPAVHIPHVYSWVCNSTQLQCHTFVGEWGVQVCTKSSSYRRIHSPGLPVALPTPGCSGCMRCYKLPDHLYPGCWSEHWSSAVVES